MKNYIIALFALGTLGFASCKKDHVCTCTSTVGNTSVTKTYQLNDQTRGDAKDACEGYEEQTTGGVVITSCRL